MRRLSVMLGVLAFCFVIWSLPCEANTAIGLKAAAGIGSGTAHKGMSPFTPALGFEFDSGVAGNWDFGAFFDYDFLLAGSSSKGGSLMFYGGLLRYYVSGGLGAYVDARLGLNQATQDNVAGDAKVGFGFRAGAKMPLSDESTQLAPYAGIHFLQSRAVFEFGVTFFWSFLEGSSG